MAATRVIVNLDTKIMKAAEKRARAEDTDLPSVLNQTMTLYAEGAFNPDDFLTKEDKVAIQRALADVKAGRFFSQEDVIDRLGF